MAKNKTEIHVTTVFDGELDATDVFVSLIAQKYSQTFLLLGAMCAGVVMAFIVIGFFLLL